MAGPRDLVTGNPIEPRSSYRAIADIIKGRIEAGTYTEGGRIPTEATLAVEFGTSRVTVNNAINALADEGLIDIRRGMGAYVTAPVTVSPRTALAFLREAMAGGGKLLLRLPSGQTRRIHIQDQ